MSEPLAFDGKTLNRATAPRGLAVVGAWALCACGGGLQTVPTGPHQDTSPPVIVATPPPPATVERVPESPGDDCVWRDGFWEWNALDYAWQPGVWVYPPAGCYFAPPVGAWAYGQRREYGYRQARWYREDRKGACPEPKICGARQLIVGE